MIVGFLSIAFGGQPLRTIWDWYSPGGYSGIHLAYVVPIHFCLSVASVGVLQLRDRWRIATALGPLWWVSFMLLAIQFGVLSWIAAGTFLFAAYPSLFRD